jgi:Fur family ferric uptake transcriptional regulator
MKHDIVSLLGASGLKVTPKRVAILEALFTSKTPLSVKILTERVEIRMDQATIYRGLEEFKRVGIVSQIYNGSEEALYECGCLDHHHHHITCTKCGLITEIDACIDSNTLTQVSKATGFAISAHSLELQGLCRQCLKK